MTLIGCRCTWGDPFSRAVLITRTLLLQNLKFNIYYLIFKLSIYFTLFQYVILLYGVKVAREILVLSVWVRILVQQHVLKSSAESNLFELCRDKKMSTQFLRQHETKAVIAQGLHLLPFRTEKLNLATPMVLPTRESRKRPPYKRVKFLTWLSF